MADTGQLAIGFLSTTLNTIYTNPTVDNVNRTVVIRVLNCNTLATDLTNCSLSHPDISAGANMPILPTNLPLKALTGGVEITKVLKPGTTLRMQASQSGVLYYHLDQIYSEPT